MDQPEFCQPFSRLMKGVYATKYQDILKKVFLNIGEDFNLKIINEFRMISLLPNQKHTAFMKTNKPIHDYLPNRKQRV